MDRIDFQKPKIVLVKHVSAEEIFNEFWNVEKDLTFAELLACEMGGETEDGEFVDATLQQAFEALQETGFWAYANVMTKAVHIWLSRPVPKRELCVLIGHEIGHILEEEIMSEIPEIAEEQRADNYGKTAYLTAQFLEQLTPYITEEK